MIRAALLLVVALAGVARAERPTAPRLAARIARGDTAALRLAPTLDNAWTLLPVISARLDVPEAARAAAIIVHHLRTNPLAAEEQEIDADVLTRTADACAGVALRDDAPPAARVDGLACAADLDDRSLARRLLSDHAPEVRRAAVALVAAGAAADDVPLLRAAAADEDATVAATAAAVLCRLGERPCPKRHR